MDDNALASVHNLSIQLREVMAHVDFHALSSMKEDLRTLQKSLAGNGAPGVLTRLSLLEQSIEKLEKDVEGIDELIRNTVVEDRKIEGERMKEFFKYLGLLTPGLLALGMKMIEWFKTFSK